MPSSLALALCTVFVVYLLRLDQKQSRGLSLRVWIPTIWTFYCASRPVASWLILDTTDKDQFSIEEGSGLDRMLLSGLIAIGLWILARSKLNWKEVYKENRWAVLLYAFMILSICWSDYPWISFKRWIKAFGSLVMALVILAEPSPSRAIEAILRRSAYVLIPFSLLLIKYFPHWGVEYDRWFGQRMWVGVTTQKNCLGRLCLISVFYLLWVLYRRWKEGSLRFQKPQVWAELMVLFLSLWLLKGPSIYAASATGIATLSLGVSIFTGMIFIRKYWKRTRFNVVRLIAIIGISLGMIIPVFGGAALGGVLSLMGRNTTFTGRTDIWELLLPIAWQTPILGQGYGSFWVDPPLPWEGLNESHNGYLEVFLELGLVGLLLLLGYLFTLCANAQRVLRINFEWAAFTICLLVTTLFHNITEASLVRASSHLWTVLLLLGALMARMGRPVKAKAPTPAPVPAPELCAKAHP